MLKKASDLVREHWRVALAVLLFALIFVAWCSRPTPMKHVEKHSEERRIDGRIEEVREQREAIEIEAQPMPPPDVDGLSAEQVVEQWTKIRRQR